MADGVSTTGINGVRVGRCEGRCEGVRVEMKQEEKGGEERVQRLCDEG